MSDDATKTLYERLGGYNAIAAVANDLLPRLRSDPQLGRFWAYRGEDGIVREKQLLIDFLCACTSRNAAVASRRTKWVPAYSNTSSAIASNGGGTFRPRAFAVLRLIAKLNLVGCWTGTAGFVPLRI
jgi:hypothetical protein